MIIRDGTFSGEFGLSINAGRVWLVIDRIKRAGLPLSIENIITAEVNQLSVDSGRRFRKVTSAGDVYSSRQFRIGFTAINTQDGTIDNQGGKFAENYPPDLCIIAHVKIYVTEGKHFVIDGQVPRKFAA
jgi:hypothetical protein